MIKHNSIKFIISQSSLNILFFKYRFHNKFNKFNKFMILIYFNDSNDLHTVANYIIRGKLYYRRGISFKKIDV